MISLQTQPAQQSGSVGRRVWLHIHIAIEKREAERRDSEAKKHKEVAYLVSYAKQLKGQLETFLTLVRCLDS